MQVEIHKLLEQEFIVEIKQVDHNVPEWYLPMQTVLTQNRATKPRSVYDASAKGQNGKSLNNHLEKGLNYITSLSRVLMAWCFDQVPYSGDMRKMFNLVQIHPDGHGQVFDKPAPDLAAAAIKTLQSIRSTAFKRS